MNVQTAYVTENIKAARYVHRATVAQQLQHVVDPHKVSRIVSGSKSVIACVHIYFHAAINAAWLNLLVTSIQHARPMSVHDL
jgi:hypothetical protein